MLFGRHLPAGRLGEFIAEHRAVHSERRKEYAALIQAIEVAPGGQPTDVYIEATIRFGLNYETMVLEWIDALPSQIVNTPDSGVLD